MMNNEMPDSSEIARREIISKFAEQSIVEFKVGGRETKIVRLSVGLGRKKVGGV